MVAYPDTGYVGRLKSLSGVLGGEGRGLVIRREDAAITFPATGYEILSSNPLRKWALISNSGGTDLTISFDSGTSVTTNFPFPAGGFIQIDEQLPWTGPVFLGGAGGASFIEASIQT